VKRSMGARRRDEIDKGEERKSGRTGFSGQWNTSAWHYYIERKSHVICQNPHNYATQKNEP
jgi:hypothetical protein